MSEHTPEPWFIDPQRGTHLIRARDDLRIANAHHSTFTSSSKTGLANARRIVACVNACNGIETEKLEKLELKEFMDASFATGRFAAKERTRADEAERLLEILHDRMTDGRRTMTEDELAENAEMIRAFLKAGET